MKQGIPSLTLGASLNLPKELKGPQLFSRFVRSFYGGGARAAVACFQTDHTLE